MQTERVEGRIALADVVRRLEQAATTHARAARRDAQIADDVEERLRTVGRLASELAEHLDALDAALPPERRPSGPHGAEPGAGR